MVANKKIENYVKSGDCILTQSSLPSIDYIHYNDFISDKETFDFENLNSYLSFLELIIMHDRLIVSTNDYFNYNNLPDLEDLDPDIIDLVFTSYKFNHKSKINLEEDALNSLEKSNILHNAGLFEVNNLSPYNIVQTHQNLPFFKQEINSSKKHITAEFPKIVDENFKKQIAFASCAQSYGIPLLLSEFSTEAKIPLYMDSYESSKIAEITGFEKSVQKSVLEYLKKHLDSGAEKELSRIEELGYETIFPRTPIATQILNEAKSPEDLLSVALTIREDFREFRQEISKFESELFDPDMTYNQKIQKMNYLEGLANEVWSQPRVGFQQVTSEISSVSNLAFEIGSSLTCQDVPSVVKIIAKAPWEITKKYLLRRKVNVLIDSKKEFMNSKDCTSNISKIFNCSEELVKNSQKEWTKSKKY
ncbi:MAG: hypothetical protein K8R13_03820 [Methanococcoides sp.]|nr:hypothetical protein [Methanococcoides sp.]